jgi:hypothetical protein
MSCCYLLLELYMLFTFLARSLMSRSLLGFAKKCSSIVEPSHRLQGLYLNIRRAGVGLRRFFLVAPLLLLGCATPGPTTSFVSGGPIGTPPPAVLAPLLNVYDESAALAARFPEPNVSFESPGLQPGRQTFTTQDELQALLKKWAQASGSVSAGKAAVGNQRPLVKLIELGSSQLGVPLQAVLFTRDVGGKPNETSRTLRPTVVLLGQQHGDEPASTEALLVLGETLANGTSEFQATLDKIDVVIFPRVNPDGAQLGKSISANGIDINRDHLLLNTPEARAVAQLLQQMQPLVVLDSHEYVVQPEFFEKFGGLQGVDAMLQYATSMNMPEFVTKAAEEWFRQPMLASLKPLGLTALWHHSTSSEPKEKTVWMGGIQNNTGRNVVGLRNTISFMIETRGAGANRQHLKRRMQTQLTMIGSILRSTAGRSADLIKLKKYVDTHTQSQACQGEMVLDAEPIAADYNLPLIHPTTGADVSALVNWESALTLTNVVTHTRPCGYWLAADQLDAVKRLRALGIQVEKLTQTVTFQGQKVSALDTRPVQFTKVQAFDAASGSYFVPLSQPLGNLALAALEPSSAHSYLRNAMVTGIDRQARVTTWPKMQRKLPTLTSVMKP